MTHTFATLGVSQATYDEIKEKLEVNGYEEQIDEYGKIDMHGLALEIEPNNDTAE